MENWIEARRSRPSPSAANNRADQHCDESVLCTNRYGSVLRGSNTDTTLPHEVSQQRHDGHEEFSAEFRSAGLPGANRYEWREQRHQCAGEGW